MSKPPNPSQPPKGKPPASQKPAVPQKPPATQKPPAVTKPPVADKPPETAPPKPVAPPPKAAVPPPKTVAPSAKPKVPVSTSPKLEIKVRYYGRARLQRVYPLVVEANRPAQAAAPVVVRPIIPGAHVVPADQKVEPGSKVAFHVTPLAKGKLTDARLEIQQAGKPVVGIPLKIKAVTQRMTWLLLLLSFMLPASLWYFTVQAPLKGHVWLLDSSGVGGKKPDANPGGGDGAKPPDDIPPPRAGGGPGALAQQPGGGGGPAVPPPPPEPGEQGPVMKLVYIPNLPGRVLSHNINEFLKKNVPETPYWNDTIRPGIVSALNSNEATKFSPMNSTGTFDGKRSLLGDLVGAGYGFLCEDEIVKMNPPFWLGFFLLLLTGFSWMTHTPRRAWAKKGLDLVEPVDPKTAPLTAPGASAPKLVASASPPKPIGPAPVNVKPKA